MKKLFYITLIFSIASLLIGAEVSVEKAQRVAGNIFIERSEMENTESLRIQDVEVVNENSNKLMYIFHYFSPILLV